ncbi:MAG: hypothetical protein SFY32_06765 [Bacteroidota bacterium]|nr:hypothetical protein [Bacteroidota bacterium]
MKAVFRIFILFFVYSINGYCQKEWTYIKEKSGIRLFQRDYGTNGIKENRAETTIKNIGYHTIIAIFRDHSSFHTWVTDMKEVRNVKSISPQEHYDYYDVKIPWPFENRDAVYHQKIFYDATDKSLNIVFRSVPDVLPEQKNRIRMKDSFGGWKFVHRGNELFVVYHHYSDPVNLPSNLINIFVPEGVFDTILRFKDFALKYGDKYKSVRYAFIPE